MQQSYRSERRRTRKLVGFILAGALIALMIVSRLSASVMVAPTVVFLDDRNPTGRLIVQNPSDKPAEVTVRFSFGLPHSDSLGNVQVSLRDSAVSDPRSAMDWLKAFPRKVIIPPFGSQTVRLIARPPKNLPDGEYWAQVLVASKDGETSVPTPDSEGGIQTRLNMIMQMAIMVKYRTGELVSDLELRNVKTITDSMSTSVLIDMTNRGNVSYMGVLHAWLYDADGTEIRHEKSNVAVYRDLRRRVDLAHPTDGDYKKPYSVEVLVTPDGRTDVPPEDLIKGNELKYSVNIE